MVILVCLCLLVLSACFSATETAVTAADKTKLKVMVENGDEKARVALELLDNVEDVITSILFGNNVVNIALTTISATWAEEKYGATGAAISSAVVVAVVFFLGESAPKTKAAFDPETVFRMFSRPLACLVHILSPICYLVSKWQGFLGEKRDDRLSRAELAVEVEESLPADEAPTVKGAISLGEKRVGDVFVHRLDMEYVDVTDSTEMVEARFDDTGLSRLVVVDGDTDHIVGTLHVKGFNRHDDGRWQDGIVPPLYAVRPMFLDDLLRQMQERHVQLAVVVDEFGGTDGVVSHEDILKVLAASVDEQPA